MTARVHRFGRRDGLGRLGVNGGCGLPVRHHRSSRIGCSHRLVALDMNCRLGLTFFGSLAALAVTPAAPAAAFAGFAARGAVRAGRIDFAACRCFV